MLIAVWIQLQNLGRFQVEFCFIQCAKEIRAQGEELDPFPICSAQERPPGKAGKLGKIQEIHEMCVISLPWNSMCLQMIIFHQFHPHWNPLGQWFYAYTKFNLRFSKSPVPYNIWKYFWLYNPSCSCSRLQSTAIMDTLPPVLRQDLACIMNKGLFSKV